MPEIIGAAVDLITGVATADLKRETAELKTESADLISENLELKERIKALKEEKENPLVYIGRLYYSEEDRDREKPFCPACYEADNKRIHLHTLKCPRCKTDYTEFEPPFVMTRSVRVSAEDVLKGY
jgi:tRNA(Ile2) C34 agmatinyltransferase TiaS